MRKVASKKMIKARSLRKRGMTLQQIAEALEITRQGARHLIMRADKFLGPPFLGSYAGFKQYRSECARNTRL